MRILQLCNKSPIPPSEGGPIAMSHLAMALTVNGHSVDVLTASTTKFQVIPDVISKHRLYNIYNNFQFVTIDTSIKLFPALKNFIFNKPYHVVRFDNPDFHQTLIRILSANSYDLIIFETLYMSPYLKTVRKYSKGKCILRSHNIEHQIWKHLANKEKNFLKKIYLSQLANSLRNFEEVILPDFDALACISQDEVDYYKSVSSKIHAFHIPFGIERIFQRSSSHDTNFYHIGSMDWMPNIEGIKWFIEKVLPLLELKNIEFRIYIGGRNTPEWLRNFRHRFVRIVGEVPEIETFVADKSILFVPLLSGSGIRIKIIEGMAMGKAVISTALGSSGLNVRNGENIFLADTPEDFADCMAELASSPEKIIQTGNAAQEFIEQEHTYKAVVEKFNAMISLLK